MKRKIKTGKIACLLVAAMLSGSVMTSCSTLHGHWGIGGEFPDYGYNSPPPPHHKPPKPPKKKKPKKHDKKHHRSDWWDD